MKVPEVILDNFSSINANGFSQPLTQLLSRVIQNQVKLDTSKSLPHSMTISYCPKISFYMPPDLIKADF
jgi:hypothetical protein